MKLLARFEKRQETWFLLIASFVFFILRLPSFFEPYWYGDEGIYEVIGFALRHGRLLYRDIWDNKPPLLYIIYSFFNGDQFGTRVFSFIVGLLSLFVFFVLAKKLFSKQRMVFVATSIYGALLALPLLEGNIANAENFMVLPTLTAALLLFTLVTNKQATTMRKAYRILLLSGLLLGLSFLIKIVAVFDFGAFFLFLAIVLYEEKTKLFVILKQLTVFSIGFGLPVVVTALFFFINGSFGAFLQSTLSSNVGYVNYNNTFLIPQGLLIFKLVLLFTFVVFLFLKRKTLQKATLFICLWLAFAIFDVFFSQRPYTHYLLVAITSLSLFATLAFYHEKFKAIFLSAFVVVLLLFVLNFPLNKKTFGYYGNFAAFVLQQKSMTDYFSFFDSVTPRDYEIADYLKSHLLPNQHIFVWGNSGQIYRLTNTLPPGRFIVAYHMLWTDKTVAETTAVLNQTKPQFVVILPDQSPIPYRMSDYRLRFSIENASIYERVF
ncbi:MAG: phospholipid carrier-dependent glycosyltransferase [Candidatus Levyibacteriota bacterium]